MHPRATWGKVLATCSLRRTRLGQLMQFRLAALALFLVSSALAAFTQILAQHDVDDPSETHIVKHYHDGHIRDIDAIGTRKIGCNRGIGNWYSLESQIAMGKDYARQVESTSRLVTDPLITEYIRRIGQNLVRNSDSQVAFTIKVIDSDDVDSGLILAADDEAELAGVMAHEIAHVAACHVARERTRGQLMNLASVSMMMVGGPIGYGVYEAAGFAMPMTVLKFSLGFESEADFLGVEYMYKAGYDPQAFTAFFERVKSLEKRRQSKIAKAFETHPQTPDRIAKTQKEINTLLPARSEYTVDTSEFQEVKAQLNRIENRRSGIENVTRPTLRRRTPTEGEPKLPLPDDKQ